MRYKNRTRYGRQPAPVSRTRKQFWQDEFANNPNANGITVQYAPRDRSPNPQGFGRWSPWAMSAVRVRNCKGKRS